MASMDGADKRIASVDALRGLVMALMLVDHVREFFYLHMQVSDPMDLHTTTAALFFTRLSSHFCAPIFVFLTGLGAWCYGQKNQRTPSDTSLYLLRRGLLLIVLELTVVGFAWGFTLSPTMLYLQVIWAIGWSMMALAILLWLPRWAQCTVGVLIVAGHHLLDGVHFTPDAAWFELWAILHDRSVMELTPALKARTSYPVLPWIGVVLLGYAAGPWYRLGASAWARQRCLALLGTAALMAFVALRWLNVYGDRVRPDAPTLLGNVMAWLNVTKYPPSLLFVLLTLGMGLLVLRQFERSQPWSWLEHFGRVPLFFYVLHLYVLHLLYVLMSQLYGPNQGLRYGVDAVWQVWLLAAMVLFMLVPVCRRAAQWKRHNPRWWNSYF